jgi:hypothetical protein
MKLDTEHFTAEQYNLAGLAVPASGTSERRNRLQTSTPMSATMILKKQVVEEQARHIMAVPSRAPPTFPKQIHLKGGNSWKDEHFWRAQPA